MRLLTVLQPILPAFLVSSQLFPSRNQQRYLPLSSFKNDSPVNKKIYFHKNVIETIKEENFMYTDTGLEYHEFTISKEKCDNITRHADILATVPESLRDNPDDYYKWFYKGPLFNFDVRPSTLSEQFGSEIYGLFAREKIPKDMAIGSYIGKLGFGANEDYEKFTYTDKGFEYIYNGDRDYIDIASIGNFMRYVNHQPGATVEATPMFIPVRHLLNRGIVNKTLAKILPKYIEVMRFSTMTEIQPGEELFVDYGDSYWDGKDVDMVRPTNMKSVHRELQVLTNKYSGLQKDHDELLDRVTQLEDNLSKLLGSDAHDEL